MLRRSLVALLVAALTLGTLACRARRTLTVTSEPAGAEVRLDRQPIGVTPLSVPFLYYGTRRLTLSKEGFLTRSERIDVDGPWYAHFPLDIVSEVFLPVGWHDDHYVHWRLEPGVEAVPLPELRSVLARANALRHAGPDGPRDLPPVRLSPTVPRPEEAPPGVLLPPLEPPGPGEEPVEQPARDAPEADVEADVDPTDAALGADPDPESEPVDDDPDEDEPSERR